MNDVFSDECLINKGRNMTGEFLAHHGVLGMKWGIRKDGKPQGWQGGSSKGSSFKKGVTKAAKGTARTAKKTATKVRAEIESSKVRRANAKAEQRLMSEANQNNNLDYDARRKISNSYKIASTTRSAQTLSKHMDVLTDAELQARINRLQKEDTVRRMAAEERDRNRSWVSKTLEKSAKQSVAGVATYGMTTAGRKAVDSLFEKASNSGGSDTTAAKTSSAKASEKIGNKTKSSKTSGFTSSDGRTSNVTYKTPKETSDFVTRRISGTPGITRRSSPKMSSDSFSKSSSFGRSHMNDMVSLNDGMSSLLGSRKTSGAIDRGASFLDDLGYSTTSSSGHVSQIDLKIPKV